MKQYPRRGQVYSLKEIENELELRDSPFLRFIPQKVCMVGEREAGIQVIQTSSVANLSDIEGWADTQWTYVRETEEWIPLFRAVDDAAIEALCVIEPDTSEFRSGDGMHIYPKGTVCNQYEPYDEKLHGDMLVRVS
ncbi:hypothetical protein pEaSNUABM35_00262 [Erwinia phage pEa_SNUABM_35]|uniref:Uncharacterized protein n=1 Tax=Erwinia phage pEa_SNUABM_35 TaxID=2869557 RepID=A0AAE7XPE2_9CAUD|nr:hypothetical protein MPK65_gp262 [Erwinia phage pEa_SNUABM_35]QZE60179.1 hypothetical protein pEaSNUABM35_00262 [Erwinia phage pEa_SNUABM_35]QZE60515.1 hypothetical protein pEaSNUABM36_00262 [Erwinia phage pEa_SNUABM_36]